MLLNNKLKVKLLIAVIVYTICVFIFTKISFFHEIDKYNKIKIDWLKVMLVAIIPSGLVFYLADSYVDKSGKFYFYGVEENSKFQNEYVYENDI